MFTKWSARTDGVFGDMADTFMSGWIGLFGDPSKPMCEVRTSLDTVPPHEAGRRPVGRHRLDQPAAGMLRRECDALCLPRPHRQPIQPELLPPVIEPIPPPELTALA